jgi:membrane-associated protease RseP (regulator of RpoE activity)
MLEEQAKIVGADIVLTKTSDEGSRQIAMPYLQYHPGTVAMTNSSGTVNANAYGSGGYAYGNANYSGSSTTTTPGTFSTEEVPITVQNYAYAATYWRKAVPPTFGVVGDALPSEMRQALQRNTGVLTRYVIDGSPAFRANILSGDVIIAFDNVPIESLQQFVAKLEDVAGKLTEVTLLRNGIEKKITVQMNLRPPKS